MSRLGEGAVVDGFVIGPRLHSGAMADLYRVSCAGGRAGFPLLMKVPRQERAMDAGPGGLAAEQRILQALQGPHVPRFVAAGDRQRQPWLVMEFVHGHTLQQLLTEAADAGARPADATIARWGQAMALAVDSLHRQEAVHRALKPANVMLRPNGDCVLLDFGRGWHAGLTELPGADTGAAPAATPWSAPEQAAGARGDAHSDLFALGVMLYELATGRLPFEVPAPDAAAWQAPQPPRALNPQLPSWLEDLILQCLEPEPQRRPPSAAQLAAGLQQPEQIGAGARAGQPACAPA